MILVLIIIRVKICSIKQGKKKDNCWSEQSPEKSTVSTVGFLLGYPEQPDILYTSIF